MQGRRGLLRLSQHALRTQTHRHGELAHVGQQPQAERLGAGHLAHALRQMLEHQPALNGGHPVPPQIKSLDRGGLARLHQRHGNGESRQPAGTDAQHRFLDGHRRAHAGEDGGIGELDHACHQRRVFAGNVGNIAHAQIAAIECAHEFQRHGAGRRQRTLR